jgi:hypothetical protein
VKGVVCSAIKQNINIRFYDSHSLKVSNQRIEFALLLFAIQIRLLLSGTFGFRFGEDYQGKNSSGLYSICSQRSAIGEVAC